MGWHGRPRPFPLAPLLNIAHVSEGQLGRRVHANGNDIRKAAAAGLTESEADRWAVRLGFHPATVWPDLWLATAEREALTLFDPDDTKETVAA